MVWEVETPSRLLNSRGHLSKRAFLFLNVQTMKPRLLEANGLDNGNKYGYRISRQTARLVRAYDLLNEVSNEIMGALCLVYTEDDSNALYGSYIEKGREALENGLFGLIREVLTANRGEAGSRFI